MKLKPLITFSPREKADIQYLILKWLGYIPEQKPLCLCHAWTEGCQVTQRGGVCGITEAFLGSPFTRALDPLFSGGLGSFRWLLYFSDSRQSVGRAAKHPPAVTSPRRWWPCFLLPCGLQEAYSSLPLLPFSLTSSSFPQLFLFSLLFVSRFFLKGLIWPLKRVLWFNFYTFLSYSILNQ